MSDHPLRTAMVVGAVSLIGAALAHADVTVITAPDTSRGSNHHYASNRPPLLPTPFVRLPVGTVHPGGWLLEQLKLQSAGFHGHLGELSDFLKKKDNAWLSAEGQGTHGWEEVPYWLKGFGDCAYLIGNEEQLEEAKLWIEAAIASQRPDGFFGPRGNGGKATVASTGGKYDLWPNMLMLNCLQSYHEFTGDKRVLDFMTKYFRFELSIPEADFLPPFWQQQRAADNLASVYWLYDRTGEPWLLELATKIHKHTANWTDDIANWHNVNMAQAFGGPTTYYQQSKDPKHLLASERNYTKIRDLYGQVPGGMFGGDENCRPGYSDPHQAVETCGLVEMMNSTERLFQITGNGIWADRCEDVAYNSLPAALTADLKALRYLTAPNMAASDKQNHSPGIQNGGPMFLMDPYSHRCCQHNFGMGWPYLAETLWMATPDDGLALIFPIESTVKAKVGDGSEVTIATKTHYPFSDHIELTVKTEKAIAFPLYLRVPGWCDQPAVTINGKEEAISGKAARQCLRIARTWSDNDVVVLTLPMEIRLRTWAKNHNSVSVDRGPLTYSLAIGEKMVRAGGTDKWPAWEILPTGPWNDGLVFDPKDLAGSFAVTQRPWPASNIPFTPENVPVVISTKGKQIPNWKLDRFRLVATLQDSPVKSDEPTKPIELIPMGAARVRISAFPVIGSGADAHGWEAPSAPAYQASASHCNESDTTDALCDGLSPKNSSDQSIPRFTWWAHKGTSEWAQYDFAKPRKVSKVEVYWFDDTGHGGCAVPQSWQVLYRDGNEWKPVPKAKPDETARDRFNTATFGPIETSGLRLQVQLKPGLSGGILEWKVE